MKEVRIGIVGATGMVGQNYITLLRNHPWFKITFLSASSKSAGKSYKEAVDLRWLMKTPLEKKVADLMVFDAEDVDAAVKNCDLIFSAVEMEKSKVALLEEQFAQAGLAVISNNSAHRSTSDVPMIIPEVNADHMNIIPIQQKNRGWKKGFIAVKPNCSIQSYMTPLFALINSGYEIEKLIVTTLQAVSGAGYPGVPSLDIVDNIIPLIRGEEEKTEKEPLKILGSISENQIILNEKIKISAHCNRVGVTDGHTACVSVKFKNQVPDTKEIIRLWENFKSYPQDKKLPFAPERPIIYNYEENRPQPLKDRDSDKGMAVTVGRLRSCNVFDYRFVGLSHNTIRGAAGGAILVAELAVSQGYI